MHNTLNTVQTVLKHVHTRTIRESHKVMARAVEEITTTRRVKIEEDTGNDDNLLLETGLEEVQTVRDGLGKTLEVQPAAMALALSYPYTRYVAAETYR